MSKTASDTESAQTVVEYMPPLNVSINENYTVQHILDTSITASKELGQIYTSVTFDLAVATKAYSLCWQFTDQYYNVIVRMGVFYVIFSHFSTLGKLLREGGFSESVIESEICASGSIDKVMSGRHYNRALGTHKLVVEGFERLLFKRFEVQCPISELLSKDTLNKLTDLAKEPDVGKLIAIDDTEDIIHYFESLKKFKDTIRKGELCKIARFWLQYIYIIHLIYALIKSTKKLIYSYILYHYIIFVHNTLHLTTKTMHGMYRFIL